MAEMKQQDIIVPDLGGHSQSKVIEVIVSVGDEVEIDQGLITLESEKAAMEVPSPYAGMIESVSVKAGDTVSPGDVIVSIKTEEVVPIKQPVESPAQQLVREPKLVQEVVATEKFRAGPFVRRIAHEMGLDLAKISGTGSSKQITPKDIRAFLSVQNIEEDADLSKYVYEVQSFGVVDASAAKQLTKSWQTVPMVTHHQYIDITDLEELRQAHKAKCEQMGGKLTLLPIIMKILAKLFTDYPVFNRMYMNSTSYAQVKTKHIGFAVDTPNGLFVPVVKDVDAKDIMTLSIEIRQLVELALKGMLKPDQMQGGSMSISSLGSITGGFFTPLIPTPQAAILGITKASLMPSMHEGHLIARLMMPVSLSYDHRVINGADAARWLVGLQSMISEVAKLEDTLLIYS